MARSSRHNRQELNHCLLAEHMLEQALNSVHRRNRPDAGAKDRWARKREQMLADTIDVTEYVVTLVESYGRC